MTQPEARTSDSILGSSTRADPTWTWPGISGPWGLLLLFILTVLAYGGGSQLAQWLIEASGLQGVLYIPSGITVALLLRLPRRWWWVVLTGAGLTELFIDATSGFSSSQAIGFAAANVAEPLLGAAIVVATCGAVDLAKRRHVAWYTLGAVILGPALGAAIGAGADRIFGGDDFIMTFFQWWLGDALGVVLVGSAILAWGSSRDRQTIFSLWGALLVAGSVALTFGAITLTDLPLVFASLIGVAIAGVLFGVRAVAMNSLAIALTIAIALTLDAGDIIIGLDPADALILIKLQVGTFTLAGLFIAAESHERDVATRQAAEFDLDRAAIESERKQEHDLAVRIQRGLLPDKLVRRPGIEIAARYQAAGGAFEVGGDWYDTIQLRGGRIGLVVGDIVGHGIDAMTSMGRLRTALAALAMHNDDPAAVLAEVDEFAGSPDGAEYATVFYAIVDPRGGTMEYASAGHPPALSISPDGQANWLDQGQAQPLYGKPAGPRRRGSTTFDPGTMLVLYTDGLIERRGEPLEVGMARLQQVVAELARGTPNWICDELFSRLADDSVRKDDAVVMVMKTEADRAADFHEWFSAEPTELRHIRSSVRSWTEARHLHARVRDDLLISIGEAASNAVRHAYGGDRKGLVEVRIKLLDGILDVEVADTGSWQTRPDGIGDPGMGTGIIQSLTDGLHIESDPNGTLVAFQLPLARPTPD